MSSLFSTVMSMSKAAIQKMQGPMDPNLVRFIPHNDLAAVPVVDREGALVLIGPRSQMAAKKEEGTIELYEIVAHTEKSNNSYSLQRIQDVAVAKITFQYFSQTLGILLELDPDLCVVGQLQGICDMLRLRPKLSPCHLAVMFDMRKIIERSHLLKFINAGDENEVTPLMTAIQKENIFMVRFLVAHGGSKQSVDVKGNSVYHYAAISNWDIIDALSHEPNSLLNECNQDGDTPLHIACKNDKPDCVQALLCAGADVNITGTLEHELPVQTASKSSNPKCVKEIIQMYPKQLHAQDIKHGGTPLHWSKSRRVIEALVDSGCFVDSKNFLGQTALHLHVRHERLDCVLALIAFEANVNLKDEAGNTALHMAVEIGNVTIVRALLVFEADTSLVNNEGDSPWTLAMKKLEGSSVLDFTRDREAVLYSLYAIGASGCSTPTDRNGRELDFKKIKSAMAAKHRRVRCLFDEMLAQKAKYRKGVPKKGGRLLSLDGGGIKGVVETRMLLSMEKLFGVPILHCFDWIIGTSTGGILALALMSGKSALECQIIYLRLKEKVFIDSKPYNNKPLDDLLKQEFGASAKMYDLKGPKVVITATMADRTPPDTQLFRNYPAPQEMLGVSDYCHPDICNTTVPSEQLIWKAAKASGAAPSFFRPEGVFVDGGILANNPSLHLLTEIAEYNMAKKALGHDDEVFEAAVLVSLGTGIPPVKKTKVVDIFRPDSAQDTIKLMMNWDGMGKLMLDSVLDADGKVVDHCRAWCLGLGTSYHRYNPQLLQDIELDEKDDKTLVDLMWMTMTFMHAKREDILALRSLLLPDDGRDDSDVVETKK